MCFPVSSIVGRSVRVPCDLDVQVSLLIPVSPPAHCQPPLCRLQRWSGIFSRKAWHCRTLAFCPVRLPERDMSLLCNTRSCFSSPVLAHSPCRGCLVYPDHFQTKGLGVKVVRLCKRDSAPWLLDLGYAATTIKQDNLGVYSGQGWRCFRVQQQRKSALPHCLRYKHLQIPVLSS